MRHALLIGVEETPDAEREFVSLAEPVAADLAAMWTALDESGYQIKTVTGREAGRSGIATAIEEAASAVPEGGTLLLYFTGHGVRHDTKDYLIPADARAPKEGPWRRSHLESLLPADVSDYLADCRAGLVLWLIDACRDPLSEPKAGFGTAVTQGQPVGRYAVMVGCSPGQRSGYSDEGSFFTRGLAEALGSLSAPRTVHEVYEAALARTARSAALAGHPQDVWIRYGSDQEEAAKATEICTGRQLLTEWEAVVTEPALWRAVGPDQDALVEQLQDALVQLVRDCARSVHRAQEGLPDPWADEDFPVRLLRILPQLLPEGRGSCRPVEVAALVAAPFLYEQARADRWLQVAGVEPLRGERLPKCGPARRHLEQVHDHYRHITGRLERCLERNRPEDAETLALWLAHRWVNERFETDEVAVPTQSSRPFAEHLTESNAAELAAAIDGLAGQIGLDLQAESEAGPEEIRVRPFGRAAQVLRPRPLAVLLRMAAALSADARALPEVVADHLAVSDPVTPEGLLRVVRKVDWERDPQGLLHLNLASPHQAVHAAMAEIVERADRMAEGIGRLRRRMPQSDAALLEAVAHRVTDNHLRPDGGAGQSPYELPLLRFQLAQTEVRELLMGRQLYGEPELALRELYQNAMDACRYRDMRLRYLRSSGGHAAKWSGEITFTQGVDAAGRRFVECEDNGVGMGQEQLKSTFTRAGRRFEQSRAFRREQADWLRHDEENLRLYPNSRFGIGVLSYFMLAEEMTVVTREVYRDGAVSRHALQVEIPSSGSLFRIKQVTGLTEDSCPEGGTRIRLYLRDDADLADLSCVDTLSRLVAMSEFRLEARHDQVVESWVPGQLRPGPWTSGGRMQPAVEGVLWWVTGPGVVLCDGIVTDRELCGRVLNLTGPHAGRLSVDRKSLQEYDLEWASETLLAGVDALLAWPELTMEWLWALEQNELSDAQLLWGELQGRGLTLPAQSPHDQQALGEVRIALDDVGWCRLDGGSYSRDYRPGESEVLPLLGPWRVAVLGHDVAFAHGGVPPVSLAGYPLLTPGDERLATAQLLGWTQVVTMAHECGTNVSELVRAGRRLRVGHRGMAAPRTLPGTSITASARLARGLSGTMELQYQHGVQRLCSERGSLDGLLWVSRAYGLTLGELVEQMGQLAPWHGRELPRIPDHHRDYVCTQDDLTMLYLGGRRVASSADVREVARGGDVEPVLAKLADFHWLGWTAPAREHALAWAGLPYGTEKFLLRQVERRADGAYELARSAAVVWAHEKQVPMDEAEDQLAELAQALGLVFEPWSELDVTARREVPSALMAALVRRARADGLDLGWIVDSSGNASAAERRQALTGLRRLGLPVPDNTALAEQWDLLSHRTRVIYSGGTGSFDGDDLPERVMTGVAMFAAALELHEPLSGVWDSVREEEGRFGGCEQALPAELRAFQPRPWHREVLTDQNERGVDSTVRSWEWVELTPQRLARFAHHAGFGTAAEAYEDLHPLRQIGALIPELTAEQVEVLRTAAPDERAVEALADEHRVSEPGTPLVPLDLVSIAGRLGETVRQVWERIEPYLPLGPAPRVPERPDVLPLWQDFAILSVYLDGLLPAVEGRVGREHVAFVAEEIGEGEEWVWDRLALYQGMFGLDLGERKQDG
ncbi:caspase family protein [Kitasatospora sp. NPDC051853]|uniref:HD domain-containing protein n=1 Tax=Kitasatospora sp. NPDC051853 TaxID=3364058 RepID=UPI0037B83D9A